MIPYDTETLRLLNASGLSLPARRFAELEYAKSDRAWVVEQVREVADARRRRSGAWVASLAAYFSPR